MVKGAFVGHLKKPVPPRAFPYERKEPQAVGAKTQDRRSAWIADDKAHEREGQAHTDCAAFGDVGHLRKLRISIPVHRLTTGKQELESHLLIQVPADLVQADL